MAEFTGADPLKINPPDKEWINYLKGINDRIDALATARQPYIADWIELGSAATYISATSVMFTEQTFPQSGRISLGTKIRLKQGGSYKYFYVTGISASVVTLNGGTDYTLTATTITDMGYSNASSPSDFPGRFNCDLALAGDGTVTVSGVSYPVHNFSIEGTKVFLFVNSTFTVVGSGGSYLQITPPVTPLAYGTTLYIAPTLNTNNGTLSMDFIYQIVGNKFNFYRVFGSPGSWSAGSGSIQAVIIYQYY